MAQERTLMERYLVAVFDVGELSAAQRGALAMEVQAQAESSPDDGSDFAGHPDVKVEITFADAWCSADNATQVPGALPWNLTVVGRNLDRRYVVFDAFAEPGDAINVAADECIKRGLFYIHCSRPRGWLGNSDTGDRS